MNAPLRHPQEAASAVSLPWTAVVEPCMGLWEPVIGPSGRPLASTFPGLAGAWAKGHPGATTVYMGYSLVEPSVEQIRAVANPPRTPVPPVSFDLSAIDPERSSFDAWRC